MFPSIKKTKLQASSTDSYSRPNFDQKVSAPSALPHLLNALLLDLIMADAQKYSLKLANKRILVIGGSSGIGYAVAEAALEHGAHVTISSSQESKIFSAVSSLLQSYPSAKPRLKGHSCNLASSELESDIQHLLSTTNAGGVKLDHIVFTAGDKLARAPLESMTLEKMQMAAMVRFNAPLLLAKHASANMNPGPASSITLTTGTVSEKPMKGWSGIAGYATGLHGMMRSLALELAPIRVNLISPGAVATPLWNDFPKEVLDGMMDRIKKSSATGEIGQPGDVAEAYLYAMRDWNLTGSVISTNGGALLTSP